PRGTAPGQCPWRSKKNRHSRTSLEPRRRCRGGGAPHFRIVGSKTGGRVYLKSSWRRPPFVSLREAMAFAYYKNLSVQEKAVYRRSDEVTFLRLPHGQAFPPFIRALQKALAGETCSETQFYAQKLVDALTQVFQVPSVQI